MSIPIGAIRPPSMIDPASAPGGGSSSPAGAFQSILNNAIGGVEQSQAASSDLMGRFLSGENVEVHQVAMAMTESQLAFDMFMQVRNKVISAYQEVMKMQM